MSIRLWTNLLDEALYPALEVVGLYARRWEQEGAFKELKIDLRGGGRLPLLSHTPHTAAQEIAALLLAQATLARMRLQAAEEARVEPLRVSFAATMDLVVPLWTLLAVGGDLLAPKQRAGLVERVQKELARFVTPSKERRARTCPRAVRQPVKGWPRLTQTRAQHGAWEYELQSEAD